MGRLIFLLVGIGVCWCAKAKSGIIFRFYSVGSHFPEDRLSGKMILQCCLILNPYGLIPILHLV